MAQKTQINPEALNAASQMILREIDLTGTDAERKAKLDQFEKDWKALTGADILNGARFVGLVGLENSRALLLYDSANGLYEGISAGTEEGNMPQMIYVDISDGSLTITPLFSHLEAITIYTDNTEPHMKQNLDNIAAYEANLRALGVDKSKSPMIPVKVDDEFNPITGFIQYQSGSADYAGLGFDKSNSSSYEIKLLGTGSVELSKILNSDYKSLNAKSLEAITIKTSNSTDDKAANKAAIEGYVNNLKSLGVDTSKGYLIPVNINPRVSSGGEGLGYMVIKPQETIYRGQYWYDLDRLVSFSVSAENGAYTWRYVDFGSPTSNLTTTSKQIVGAINEVNGKIGDINTILANIAGE